ncbi:orotidine-5'-phosphate decarboxylase [Synechococcus sp. M16CYN]|uniref:orotidine-5'-phosphate decarboxylase n=1 Tax=Synechococcus sp. M16CYN TaxID=3103139 RepID=UPI00324323EA
MLSADPADRIIVALDGMTPNQALTFSLDVAGLRWVKVGLELFIQAGPSVVTQLQQQGLRVFLDLKFHDIPATMASSCRYAAVLGAELITVHACAGSKALKASQTAAIEGAQSVGLAIPTLLATTVLTSWEEKQMQRDLTLTESITQRVLTLTKLAADSGVGGCVCSPLETAVLRRQYPDPFALVTPGIRFKGDDMTDQARVMGPRETVAAGASQLVIGRPITKAEHPGLAFAACCRTLVGS